MAVDGMDNRTGEATVCFDDVNAALKAAQDGVVVIKGEKGEDTVVEMSLREGFTYHKGRRSLQNAPIPPTPPQTTTSSYNFGKQGGGTTGDLVGSSYEESDSRYTNSVNPSNSLMGSVATMRVYQHELGEQQPQLPHQATGFHSSFPAPTPATGVGPYAPNTRAQGGTERNQGGMPYKQQHQQVNVHNLFAKPNFAQPQQQQHQQAQRGRGRGQPAKRGQQQSRGHSGVSAPHVQGILQPNPHIDSYSNFDINRQPSAAEGVSKLGMEQSPLYEQYNHHPTTQPPNPNLNPQSGPPVVQQHQSSYLLNPTTMIGERKDASRQWNPPSHY